ncbi:Transcriptional activator spt7, partial [Ascosphaera aggregata]
MSLGQNHTWLLPGHLRPPDGTANQNKSTTGALTSANANANATITPTSSFLAPTPSTIASNTDSAATVTSNGVPSVNTGIGADDNVNGSRGLTTLNGAGGAVNSSMVGARYHPASPGSVFSSSPSKLVNGAVVSSDAAQVSSSSGARQSRNGANGEGNATITISSTAAEEDPRIALFRDRYLSTEARINKLFSGEGKRLFLQPKKETDAVETRKEGDVLGNYGVAVPSTEKVLSVDIPATATTATDTATTTATNTATVIATAEPEQPQQPQPPQNPTRKLDDDDYDEYDEDDEDEEEATPATATAATTDTSTTQPEQPPISTATAIPAAVQSTPPASAVPLTPTAVVTAIPLRQSQVQQAQPLKESAEDVRKKLEQDKKAMEEFVKRSFHTMFFTLEDDRDAMLDQQKLEETERQIEAEMFAQRANARAHGGHASGGPTSGSVSGQSGRPGEIGSGYGPLSNVNLGSSSLALKNLIERIDMKRSEVMASDAELRNLM